MLPEQPGLGARLVLALLLAAPGISHAQSNYRLAPVGGRSSLLGGTGVVYGRDAAAGFLNPATAMLADDNRLSFSVNFYTMNLVLAPRWYEPGPIDRRHFGALQLQNQATTDFEFNALPSSLCLFMRLGTIKAVTRRSRDARVQNARLGLCFATVQDQIFNFAAEGYNEVSGAGVTRQAQTVSQSYTRFAAGPTFAIDVTPALALGVSLHATLATHRSLFAASAATYGSTNSPEGSGAPITSMFYSGSRGDAFQLEPVVGASYRFGRQKVGVSIKSPSVHVYGVGGANRQSHYDGAGSATSTVTAAGSFVSRSPLRVSMGTGVEAGWGNAELNTSFSAPTHAYSAELEGNAIDVAEGEVNDRAVRYSLTERARGVVNASLGVELFLSPRISALGGFSTDFSAVSKGTLQDSLFNYYPSRTHRVAASFGLASHGEGGELLLGGELSGGWGERLAVNSYQLPPTIGTTGHGTYQLMFIIAGSTSLKAITRAVNDVKGALKAPALPPAGAALPQPSAPQPAPRTQAEAQPAPP